MKKYSKQDYLFLQYAGNVRRMSTILAYVEIKMNQFINQRRDNWYVWDSKDLEQLSGALDAVSILDSRNLDLKEKMQEYGVYDRRMESIKLLESRLKEKQRNFESVLSKSNAAGLDSSVEYALKDDRFNAIVAAKRRYKQKSIFERMRLKSPAKAASADSSTMVIDNMYVDKKLFPNYSSTLVDRQGRELTDDILRNASEDERSQTYGRSR